MTGLDSLMALVAWAYLNLPALVIFAAFIGVLTWVVDRDEARANRMADKVYRWRR